MAEWDQDLENIYKTGGCFAPDRERNDSIENNQDNRSDRERELNMFEDNYERRFQGKQNQALNDPILQQINKDQDRDSIEFRLQNRAGFEDYNEELTRFIANLEQYSPPRVERVVEIAIGENRRPTSVEMQFCLHCILLKKISSFLNHIEDVEIYRDVLNVILDKKKQFYSFNFNEESIQVMNLYLDQENPDFNSIYSLLAEVNDLQIPPASQQTSSYLYRYFFEMFYRNCMRPSKPIFNLYLLSKIDGDIVENLIEENRSYFYVQNAIAFDKKDFEEYINLLFQLSKESRIVLKEYLLAITLQLIRDNQQMEKKLSGFKIINDLIVESKNRQKLKYDIVNWLVQTKIIENFLRDSTHSRILREVQPVIHFLYESGVLTDIEIIELMKNSLASEQIFKVVQSMLGWLKLQHLFLVFQIIPYYSDRESSLFISFISTVLSNPLICEDNSRKRKNLIIQDNRKHLDDEMEQQVDEQSQLMKQFVKKFLRYLIEFSLQHQSHYIPILLKLITSHSKFFKDDLFNEVVKLLRNNSVCSLWIIQHWLKIETARDRGQGKYELITSLASQGVFELMLALLARHRFSRPVVQKALSVIIFFCRFNKPLERNITEFLWKVLGLTGRDQRERQQFFVFLKQLVRFEGSITEQSVNLIFFEILMSLVGDWFTLRVYDCLQMLFLRLNEDCKLISFDKDHYKIEKEPLIGMDKFIYIYFNCLDLKVVRKSKDFICKLIANSEETKEAMNKYLIAHLKKYMGYALQMNKPEDENKRQVILLRLFELAQKNCLQKDKIEEVKENLLTFNIHTSSSYNLGAKNFTLQVNEKITLSDLRCYIGEQLNPPLKDIELWTKGKLQKGQNLTLKELRLQNGQTITVSEREVMEVESDKKAIEKEQLQLLTMLVGNELEEQFLRFIINKYEGETIQTIANYVFDAQRMTSLLEQYKENKIEREDCVIEVEEKQRTFAVLLVKEHQVLEMVLQCYRLTNNKPNTWKLIQRLPLNQAYLAKVQSHIETGTWRELFFNKTTEQSMYILHIITHLIKNNDSLKTQILKEKQLGLYLKSWLQSIVKEKPAELQHFEQMMKLLLAEIECPIITLMDEFLLKKEISETDFQIVTLYTKATEKYSRQIFHMDEQVTESMIGSLLLFDIPAKVVNQVSKIYIMQLIYPAETHKCYSILNHKDLPQLLLKYGKPIQFITIATALQLQYTSSHSFLRNFVFKLIETLDLSKKQKENKLCIPSFFSCVNELLKITPIFDAEEELRTLIKLLYHLKSDISKFEQEEVVGYFTISLTLLDRHFKAQNSIQSQNQDIFIIGQWLFNEYLFGTKAPYPFFSCKNIRKTAYQLMLRMCRYTDVSSEVVDSVKSLMKDFKDLDEKEGDIRSGQFVGIKNLGATCYINSLLQQLYHTNFPKYLLEQDNQPNPNQLKMLQLKKIFAHLYCGIRSPVYPNDFIDTAKINGEPVRPMVQQDVNEFFASLMHNIEQEVGNSAINQTISGTVSHEIRGLQQGSQVKNVEQTFLTMMIDIKYRKNLHEAICAFTKPHVLEGENMYYSQVLHKKIRASSKTYLGKLPNLLVITLKRFCWNFETMNRTKINDYFEFPLELELSRYAFPGRKEQNPHYFDYRLCGIIIHSGSAESGHYYSLIKINDQWFEFNDKRVSPWDITNNLKTQCFGGNDQRSKNAYMLFYQRVGSEAHGCSLNKLSQSNAILQMVQNQNQSFLLNRLFYDSNYIDFVKELAQLTRKNEILKLLEKLKYYRHKNNDTELRNNFEQVQLRKQNESVDDVLRSPVQKVTQEEVERFAERFYPQNKELTKVHFDAEDNTGFNDPDIDIE